MPQTHLPPGVYSCSWIPKKFGDPRDRSTYTEWEMSDNGSTVSLVDGEWIALNPHGEEQGRFKTAGDAMGHLFNLALKGE
jgi:hypothetical protein